MADEDSIDQIGCIHTVQGLDLDYVGVIIAEDLRYEDGKLITDSAKHPEDDYAINKHQLDLRYPDPIEAKQIEDTLIKNTYRVLMSRGMKGCYIYCMDENLAEYFKKAAGNLKQTNI